MSWEMAKVKREFNETAAASPASSSASSPSSPASSSPSSARDQQRNEEPQRKRHKPSQLNFSIESIIAPASFGPYPGSGAKQTGATNNNNNNNRSPSVASDRSSGAESSATLDLQQPASQPQAGRHQHQHQHLHQGLSNHHYESYHHHLHHQHHHHHNSRHRHQPSPTVSSRSSLSPQSPLASSPASSRASTPISPGAPGLALGANLQEAKWPRLPGGPKQRPATNGSSGGPLSSAQDGPSSSWSKERSLVSSSASSSSSLGINQLQQSGPKRAACQQQTQQQQQQQQPAASSSGDSRLSQVECVLDNKDIWNNFHSLNTEMIITKTGRRMFPVMKVQFHNLDPNARYAVSMDIVPVDNKRYRYAYHKSCWAVAGKADPSAEPRLYPHPDSPFQGDLLARQVISFEKVKLTNNEMDKSGHIILNSMHKYQPRVHLIELKVPPSQQQQQQPATSKFHHQHHNHPLDHHNQHQHHHHHHQQLPQQPQQQLDIEGYRTFVFPETVFTAVTAYQNQLITKMKIDKNPFAKGFRDSSRLSDLDRNDPFDYMGSLGPSSRFGPQPGGPGMEAAAAAAAAAGMAQMDAYQLLAASTAAAQNPWYSAAAAAAAAASGGASAAGPVTPSGAPPGAPAMPPNPFSSMGAMPGASAQAAQFQAQMWLAAFSACFNQGSMSAGPSPVDSALGLGGKVPAENGPDSSAGRT